LSMERRNEGKKDRIVDEGLNEIKLARMEW
jgi:hypothetical protein